MRHVAANVSLGYIAYQHCFKQIWFQSLLENRWTQGRVPEIVRQIVPEGGPRSGVVSWPNRFCFCSRHKKITSHRRAKVGEGRNSWFQYKHLREVCRSDTMEALVNEKTHVEVDFWTDGSQCRRSRMSAEMGSNLRFRRTRRAAAFITVCSWSIKPSPIPASRLLQ